MWFSKSCIACGFLGWCLLQVEPDGTSLGRAVLEATKINRDDARSSAERVCQPTYDPALNAEGWHILGCYRSQWSHFISPESKSSQRKLFEEVVKKRHCNFYINYEASYKPEQHLQIQEKIKDRTVQLRNIFYGAFAVALSTAFIELIRWIFSKK